MDALLTVEPQILPIEALPLHGLAALEALERRAHEVDGGGEIVGARRGDDCGAGVEEFGW